MDLFMLHEECQRKKRDILGTFEFGQRIWLDSATLINTETKQTRENCPISPKQPENAQLKYPSLIKQQK